MAYKFRKPVSAEEKKRRDDLMQDEAYMRYAVLHGVPEGGYRAVEKNRMSEGSSISQRLKSAKKQGYDFTGVLQPERGAKQRRATADEASWDPALEKGDPIYNYAASTLWDTQSPLAKALADYQPGGSPGGYLQYLRDLDPQLAENFTEMMRDRGTEGLWGFSSSGVDPHHMAGTSAGYGLDPGKSYGWWLNQTWD